MKGIQTLTIEHFLKSAGLEFKKEFRLSKKRRFKFDYAIPLLMVAI